MEQAYNKNYCSNMSFKLLPLAITSLMVTNVTTHASDIEMYKAASEGGATVMLVFDNSGSMDERSIEVDYASDGISIDYDDNDNAYCSKNNMIDYISTSQLPQAIYNDDGAANTTISPTAVNYSVNSCTIGGKTYYDRISRLKLALMPLIANPKSAFGNGVDFTRYKIGLANFFYTNSSTGGGKISYPAYEFTLANRTEMLSCIHIPRCIDSIG